jgi:predicted flap endonuclease-1-like 5' DNA nuclease
MNPIFFWWLTLGALIGFVAAWVWDWLWFRARRRVVSTEVDTQVSTLTSERNRLAADLRACGERRTALDGELKAAQGELTTVRGQLTSAQGDLSAARGQISALQGELDGLRMRLGELETANAGLQTALDEARTGSVLLGGTALAARAVGANGQENDIVTSLREYNVSLHDELDATRRTLARFAAGRGDPLIDIDGIGPVYQNKLYDAGVVSFDQVAAMHPDRLRSLVAPNAVFELNTDTWIDQARRFAGAPVRDPLIDINGVGPVYEQRLLNAGVYSFAQLGKMSPDEIRAIIRPEAWQLIEPEAWIAEARQLAAQVQAGTYRKGEY